MQQPDQGAGAWAGWGRAVGCGQAGQGTGCGRATLVRRRDEHEEGSRR